jgi:hypothetical protein
MFCSVLHDESKTAIYKQSSKKLINNHSLTGCWITDEHNDTAPIYFYIRLKSLHKTKCITKVDSK